MFPDEWEDDEGLLGNPYLPPNIETWTVNWYSHRSNPDKVLQDQAVFRMASIVYKPATATLDIVVP